MTAFDVGARDGIAKVAADTRGAAAREFAGLGLIAAPAAHGLIQRARGRKLTHGQEQAHAVSDLTGLGLLAAPYAKRLLTKRAAASPPGTTGVSPTTSGEFEREVSASDVTGRVTALPDMRERVDAGPRPPKRRGVPEWILAFRHLHAKDGIR